MSFSFNWAGLNMPSVSFNKAVDDQDFGKNLGLAARGFDNRQAAKDYADKIDTFRMSQNAKAMSDKTRVENIKAEIARLVKENEAIDAQLAQAVPTQPQNPYAVPQEDPEYTEEELQAVSFNPDTATRDQIKAMQRIVGTTPDGAWGPKSRAAWDAKYGYLLDASNGISFGGF